MYYSSKTKIIKSPPFAWTIFIEGIVVHEDKQDLAHSAYEFAVR